MSHPIHNNRIGTVPMTARSPEQQLVDIMFEVAIKGVLWGYAERGKVDPKPIPNERVAEWVSSNLRQCGFPTHPMGSSWGVLDQQPCEMDT